MRTKKRWLAVSCLAVCLLLVIAGHASVQAETQPEAGYLNECFLIGLPVETLTCVYQAERRGWMGAGVAYSVWWQCQDSAALFHALPWRYGRAFQDQLFDRITEQAVPDGQTLPLLEGQKAYYHVRSKSIGQNPWTAPQRLEYGHKLQAHEIVDAYDDELLLVYAPQITLGNRQTYRNILFVLEQYTRKKILEREKAGGVGTLLAFSLFMFCEAVTSILKMLQRFCTSHSAELPL